MSHVTEKLRSRVNRWASSASMEAQELRDTTEKSGCCLVEAALDRELVTLQGTLRTVTLRPRGGVPALEAELYDGTGVITVIWLGRRRIAGIKPGRQIKVQGRIGVHDG